MATVGLKGIWGLEQLDKTGIATWKLGLILMGAAGVVGYILMQLMIGMAPNPAMPIPTRLLAPLTFGLVFVTAGLVVLILALARAVELDLRGLTSFDRVIEASIERLRPKRAVRITCYVLGLLYGYVFLPASTLQYNYTFIETFIASIGGGPNLIFIFIMGPIGGLVTGMVSAIIISQILSLVHAARHIKVDLLQLNDYAAIANPGVRVFLCIIPILSVFPLMMLYLDDPSDKAATMQILLFSVIWASAILLPYAYPVWILRNRIRDKKIAEMGQITLALRGDKEAVKTIVIRGLGTPTTTAELLTHQMFLESRWEWPIASHIQKLVLFGLLPPLAWVLAAMIENSMY